MHHCHFLERNVYFTSRHIRELVSDLVIKPAHVHTEWQETKNQTTTRLFISRPHLLLPDCLQLAKEMQCSRSKPITQQTANHCSKMTSQTFAFMWISLKNLYLVLNSLPHSTRHSGWCKRVYSSIFKNMTQGGERKLRIWSFWPNQR